MSVLADCSLNGLNQASKCFQCLSETERQALNAWFMAQALKAFGGTDLTNVATRNQAVACLTCESDFALSSMETAVWQKLASLAGATVDLPIQTLRANIKCTPCGEQKSTRAAYLRLLCELTLISR